MKKNIKRHFFIALTWLMSTQIAHAALELYITEGIDTAMPIAVLPFTWQGDKQLPVDIAAVVSADLQRTGKFSPLAVANMPQTPTTLESIDFTAWSEKGVDSLVLGNVEPAPNGEYLIRYQLVDIVSGKAAIGVEHVLLNNRKTVQAGQMRAYAHRISDLVYEKLTGTTGAFLTRIAYVVVNDKESHPYQLRVADYDGYNESTVLKSKQPLMSPSWSPDGSKLAYVSFENGRSQIYVMDIYTGKRDLITSYPRHNGSPRFSPDGTKLALVLSKTGSLHTYIYDLKTRKLTQITNGRSNNTEPFWDPSGNSLIFTSDRGGKPQIYRVNLASTSDIERITWQGSQNLGGQLTPDGKYLVMVHQSDSGYNIAKQELRTGSVEILTKTMLDESPSLAPNGSMIMYSSIYGDKNVLSLVSFDGRFKARMPIAHGRVRAPAWSPLQ